MELKDYQKIKDEMIEADRKRDSYFKAYEDIAHLKDNMPEDWIELGWIHWINSTDPYDALETGVRILSTVDPKVTFQPMASDLSTRERANMIEKVLKWNFDCANSRREETIQGDMMRSALLYRAIVAQVIDLDWQIQALEFIGANTKRWKAMRRYGRFVVNTYNPRDVHVRRSGIMPECVLLAQKKSAKAVVDEWGKYCNKDLKKMAEDNITVTYFDLMDYENHVNWIEPSDFGGSTIQIIPKSDWEHGLSFLPWTTIMGGTTLEQEEEHKYKPMFYGINLSGQWKTQNMAQSLWVSDVLARASYPRYAEEGVNEAQNTEIDYTAPDRIAKVPMGNVLKALPPEQGDPALKEVNDFIASQVDKATLSRILIGGNIPSGMAFSSLNLMTQNALGVVKPAIRLTERAVAEVMKLFMLWSEQSGISLNGYGKNKKRDIGQEYIIESNTIDPQALYLEVEMMPDQPTDRQSRINAAAIMVQAFDISKESALEMVGISDPLSLMEARYMEKMVENRIQTIMDTERMRSQMQVQMEAQAITMQMQQSATQQMQPGTGVNPQGGALPPQMGAQGEMNRENVTGQSFTGEELATMNEVLG